MLTHERKAIVKTLICLLRDDAGSAAVEYGLIAGLIALAIIAGATTIGTSLSTTFSNVASSI